MALSALALVLGSAPAGADPIRKISAMVAVRSPDELGRRVWIDTDAYLPQRRLSRASRPLVLVFHGGGSDKSNGFDAGHARALAERGYVTLIYSARGHGHSGGQTTVAGPKEMRDTFDVLRWALHNRELDIDRNRIALSGYSQGGLNTNGAQIHALDRDINPERLRFRALLPGNTPDYVFDALVREGAVKLSFGVGLLQTYMSGAHGNVEPIVDKWIATAAADLPQLYGGVAHCDSTVHDTLASAMRSDLAWRSVGCAPNRLGLPWHWAQAFDDELFLPDMAISMWRRTPRRDRHFLYLSMGGHGAPAADRSIEADKFAAQVALLDHVMRGTPLHLAPVVYWSRDPAIVVPGASFAYPAHAWIRHRSSTWPPRGVRSVTYGLGADGRLVRAPDTAQRRDLVLAPLSQDLAHDPVALSAFSGSPLGTSPLPRGIPATSSPGLVAAFRTPPAAREAEFSGSPRAHLRFAALGGDSQLVLKIFDRSSDGAMTLLSRGIATVRGRPFTPRTLDVAGNAFSALIRRGHSLLVYVTTSDASFFKPLLGSLGGTLTAGPASTVTLPIKGTAPGG